MGISFVTIDEGTAKKIGVIEKTEESSDIEIQRISKDTYPVVLQGLRDSSTSTGESDKISCAGYEKVYFKCLFSDSSAGATVYVCYYDFEGNKVLGDSITVANTGVQDSNNYYIGELIEVEVLGFKQVSLYVKTAPTSGSMMVYGGGAEGDAILTERILAMAGYASDATQYVDAVYESTDTTLTSLPSPARRECNGGALGPEAFCTFGYGSDYLRDNDKFLLNTWAASTDGLSPARSGVASTPLSSEIYVWGGYTGSRIRNNESFDKSSWSTHTQLLSPGRELSGATDLSGTGYIVGGMTGSDYASNLTQSFASNTWSAKANMPAARGGLVAVTINSKIYSLEGQDDYDPYGNTYEYTPNTWATKATNSSQKARHAGGAINNKGYTIAGHGNTGSNVSSIYYFTPSANTWTSSGSINTARWELGSATIH